MISTVDRSRIVELGVKYGATRIMLFGSSIRQDAQGRDYDIAVKGVSPAVFFDLYGELMLSLSKPVDLVDLDKRSPFVDLVAAEGVALYG